MILLLVLSALNLVLEPKTAASSQDYAAIRQEFNRKTELIAKKETEIMHRYHPGNMEEVTSAAVTDTTPIQPDTTVKEVKSSAEQDTTKININTAGPERLQKLPGVGPVYAQRIVAYRDTSGQFQTVRELIKIKGIGDKRLENMKSMIEL